LGQPVVEKLAQAVSTPIDAHLMIAHPERWAAGYAEAGAASVTFHFEAATQPLEVIRSIRATGARVGMGIKPGTSLDDVLEYLPHLDMLLVMTVEPGFGGQAFMADMMPKVRQARSIINAEDLALTIQVDGGVSLSTIEQCAEAGANIFVAGSAVYNTQDPAAACSQLRSLATVAAEGSWWCCT
jgi:ribulose-phosphate 3-epimerase